MALEEGNTQALDIREADNNWEMIRDKVVEEQFGPTVVPVPFLEDAASYDLLTVLIKKPGRPPGLLGRARPLVPVGTLGTLLQPGAGLPGAAERPPAAGGAGQGQARYEETRVVEGAPRRVALRLAGLHAAAAAVPELCRGRPALRPELPWLPGRRSLYLLHQVFYSSELALTVTQGSARRCLRIARPCPIAFRCLKVPLGPRGALGPPKPLAGALRAPWVRLATLDPALLRPAPAGDEAAGAAEPRDPPLQPARAPAGKGAGRGAAGAAGSAETRAHAGPPLPGKWPFSRRREPAPGLGDPDRHSMSLPLLQSPPGDSDGEA
ncbi:uncharacterized protein C11orf42 homolog [Struthio camelus]|uniref:uncharacterized protein C11orf42 homolog n=1 Tax=Struthio camelus TaxID=8801 RepID=UPI00360413EF